MPTLTDRAVAWIEQQTPDRPFFLYFPFTSPHAPILPTEAFTGGSAAGPCGDFLAQTDDTVGRVLHALQARGLAANTLVIFTSDNGPERYAYERTRAFGHRSMGPLRGLKRDLWEGGHRVPMIVRYPGHVPRERVADGYALRQDDWILIDAPSGGISEIPAWYRDAEGIPADAHPGELYNLRTDLGERHNRFDSEPDRVAAMKQRLDTMLDR